ncbi:hypothetical protein ACUWEX_11145 [Okibacterium fritillariae]|uniref:hypothetical protein n=1 Tax=Okibacterium fritillariae TaxID=123320 RepID=UPI004055375B
MAGFSRGEWLEVIREVWKKRTDAVTALDEASALLRPGKTRPSGDVEEYIDQKTPQWEVAYARIADAEDAVKRTRKEWKRDMARATSWRDEAHSLAWLEWIFETGHTLQGLNELEQAVPDHLDLNSDPRLRAAKRRGIAI